MTLSIDRIRKAREAGYDDDKILDSIEKRDPEFGARIKKARDSGYDSAKIMQSIEKRLAMQTNQATPETQAIQPNQPIQGTSSIQPNQPKQVTPANKSTPASSLVNSVKPNQSQSIGQSFKSGLQSSASGELAKSVFGGKSEEEVAQDPGFWAQLVHTGGELTGDTPYFLAGASLGGALGSVFGPLGAVVGGSAGAMAMPAFIKESLKEYRKYVEKGNDLTFGEFLNSADKVASKTLNQGLFGVILGSVNKAMPLLKNIPGIGNLFNSKIAQKGATVAAEAATVATVPAVSEGRLPTTNDFAHALALVAGLNILHIPGAIRDKINKQGKASGLTPEAFAVKELVSNVGFAPVPESNELFAKSPKDQINYVASNVGFAPVTKSNEPIAKERLTDKKKIPLSIRERIENSIIENSPFSESFKVENKKIFKEKEKTAKAFKSVVEGNDISTSEKSLLKNTRVALLETREGGQQFHGTPSRIEQLEKDFDGSVRNIYGQGLYTTDALDIADGYSKARKQGQKNKIPTVYLVIEKTPQKLYNAEKPILEFKQWFASDAVSYLETLKKETPDKTDPQTRKKYKDITQKEYLDRNMGIIGELLYKSNGPKNLRKLYDSIVDYAEDDGLRAYEVQEYFDEIRSILEKKGYQGLSHIGGLQTGRKPHKVNIYWNPENLDIEEFYYPKVFKKVNKIGSKNQREQLAELFLDKPKADVLKERVQREQRDKKKAVNLQTEVAPKEIEQPTKSEEQPEQPTKSQDQPENVEQKTPQEMEKSIPTADQAIEETTGMSASDRISYMKTRSEKIVDVLNAIVTAIKNPKETIKKMGAATNKAVFNILAPLEKLEEDIPVHERVSTRIKMAQSAASEINSTLENGIFSNLTGKIESDSLKNAYGDLVWREIGKDLPDGEYSLRELDVYRTSKIALKRQKEGKQTGIGTKEAKEDVDRLHDKYEPVDQRIRKFQKDVLNHYGKDLLGQELIAIWNEDYYSPLYRVMESGNDAILQSSSLAPRRPFFKFKGSEREILPASESDIYNSATLIRNSRKNDAVLQYKKMVEQGKLPGEIIKKPKPQEIPEEISKDLDLDEGTQEVAENLYAQSRKDSFTPRKNIIRGWENGKMFEIEVPKDIYDIYSTLTPQEYGVLPKILNATNRLFSKSISFAPRKFVSIFGRDAISSLIYSRTSSNPISIVEALSDIFGQKDIYKQFLSLGGDVYAAKLSQRLDRVGRVEGLIKPKSDGMVVPFDKIAEYFGKFGDLLGAISMAVPLAEYKRALKVYGDTAEGRIMAAMEARRVTYDPTRRGGAKIVRELANYIPFWNVSLQDFAMLGKNLNNKETWAKGIAAITLPTLALKMLNDDNPDYQDLTPEDKADYWHLFYGDSHIRIPIPWLLGTTFKVGPELFFDIAKSRGGEAWQGLYHNFAQNLSGSTPPLLQAFVQATLEKTLPSPLGFALGTETNAPDVVPKRLKGLPANEQYTSKTSQLARWFGNMWGISPVKLEAITKTMGGLVAADALALVDEIAYWSGLAEDKRPEQKEKNYLLLGHFVSNNTPTRTKYATQFYKMLDEERRAKTPLGKTLTHYNTKISKSFRKYREIEDSKIDPREKKQKLTKLQVEINALYKEAVKNSTKQ